MDEQIRNYVLDARTKGMSDDSIRTALLGVGWKKEDVEMALGKRAIVPLQHNQTIKYIIFYFSCILIVVLLSIAENFQYGDFFHTFAMVKNRVEGDPAPSFYWSLYQFGNLFTVLVAFIVYEGKLFKAKEMGQLNPKMASFFVSKICFYSALFIFFLGVILASVGLWDGTGIAIFQVIGIPFGLFIYLYFLLSIRKMVLFFFHNKNFRLLIFLNKYVYAINIILLLFAFQLGGSIYKDYKSDGTIRLSSTYGNPYHQSVRAINKNDISLCGNADDIGLQPVSECQRLFYSSVRNLNP